MDPLSIAYCIFTPISITSQAILMYGYLRIKKMRKHPEMMIFWQLVFQFVIEFRWLTGIYEIRHSLSSRACQCLGAFFVFCYYANWDFILFLSIEVLIKVRSPLNCNYRNRVRVFHIFIILSSLAIFAVLVAVSNNNGRSVLGTCFVQGRSIYELIGLAPVVIHFPICAFCCLYALFVSRNLKCVHYSIHQIYVITVFSISWVPLGITHWLSYEGFHVKTVNSAADVNIM